MLRRPLLSIFLCEAVACGPREAPMHDSTVTPATPATPAPPAPPATPATKPAAPLATLGLPDFVAARLDLPGNPIEALAHGLPAERLTALGVRDYRAFTATAPRVWLLVFRFDDQPTLRARQSELEALLTAGGDGDVGAPPFSVKSTHTGSWLLVTGFPSHKPVSPEMEAARTAFLGRFAGEE